MAVLYQKPKFTAAYQSQLHDLHTIFLELLIKQKRGPPHHSPYLVRISERDQKVRISINENRKLSPK